MKLIVTTILSLTLLGLPGCKTVTSSTAPQTLAPGYSNAADEAMGETLVGARNFYVTIQADVVSGKYTPSAAEKTVLNNFALALNSAELIYKAYHTGSATSAQAQAAVDAVTVQQSTIQATVTGGK